MSNEYITVEVSEATASLARRVVLSFTAVGIVLLIISTIAFIDGNDDVAIPTVIAGFGVIVLGILIYMIIALIGSMKSSEAQMIAKRIAIILPSTLAFFFLLLWVLGGI
ncbi:MAG: hypothetical protein INQ03_23285 [Candidatus Heimdallarchaeota archaeon]|nr:hypothetical protein [Candidatus Heimdallarchaeota archaeon]